MSYKAHPDMPDIEDSDTVLWRYIDLYKWLDFLQTSELHLTRADQMEDRWEGAYSKVNTAERASRYGKDWPAVAKVLSTIPQYARTHTYLNCWHVGEGESYAMWKIYGAAGIGVAIRTTSGRLKESLIGTRQSPIFGARVQYVDYTKTYIPEANMFFPYTHKRSSFSYENEYRLLAEWRPDVLEMNEQKIATRKEPDLPPPFLREPVHLDRLVERVYVSPDAPNWMDRVVRQVTGKYVPGLDIRPSDLAVDPVY